MDCPDDNVLSELVEGALPPAELAAVEAHVDDCAACRALLVELAPALDEDPLEPSTAQAWDAVLGSRYVPEEILGAGGMSIVYRGRDQVLDRPVALKVMLDAPADLRAWLRREARALAMLSHPNVVGVYDVDLSEGSTFLACELVDGGNLRAWAGQAPRSMADKLAMILDAVRGLEAAHAMGIVHRDVTPNNILVGSDGRARVSDFGLARLGPAVETAPESPDLDREDFSQSGEDSMEDAGPQRTGVVGTPGYIAPEVLDGLDATPATDQYGLCVTAYELVHGHLPGQAPDSERSDVPRALDRVLAQGLRTDPRARHPSMTALRRALEAVSRPAWRSRAAAAGVVVIGAASLGLGASTSTEACGGYGAQAPSSLALDTASLPDRVAAEVSRYADDWARTRARICHATTEHTTAAGALDRRWACLRDRQDGLASLVEAFAHREDTPGLVAEELTLLEQLPGSDGCEDDMRLARGFPLPPPAIAGEVEVLQGKLRRARSRLWSDERSRDAVNEVLEAAAQLRYDPLTARALMYRGHFERDGGEVDKARETLEAAALLAMASGADQNAAFSWIALIEIEAYAGQDLDAALALLPQVDSLITRLGDPPDVLASRAGALALAYDVAAQFEHATRHHEDALRYTAEARGVDSLAYAEQLNNYAAHHNRRGDLEAARTRTEQALAIFRARLGEHSLNEALILRNLAVLANATEDGPEAVRLAERAVEIARMHLDADDARLGPLLTTLGHARVVAGEPAEGVAALERALVLTSRHRPPEHTMVIDARRVLAEGYAQAGRLADADRELGQALDDLPEGSDYFRTLLLAERGMVWARQGRADEALALCVQAQTLADGIADGALVEEAARCLRTVRDRDTDPGEPS